MIVVANSSPLIGFARIDILEILKSLYRQVLISKEVFFEITEKGKGKPGEREIKEAPWIKVVPIKNKELLRRYTEILNTPDATVIALAKETNADLVIVDDKELRKLAKREGMSVTGTIGVLLQAKEEGWISSVRERLDELRQKEFRIDDEMYEYALKKAGE